MIRPPTVAPFLWFTSEALAAAEFYVSLFPDSGIEDVEMQDGKPFIVSFRLSGIPYTALNGGPYQALTPAFSLAVTCDGQAEVDRLWAALTEGGQESRCGWLTDRFGVSWQVVPQQFFDLRKSGTPAQSQAVMAAMMEMIRFDVAALESAFDSAAPPAH